MTHVNRDRTAFALVVASLFAPAIGVPATGLHVQMTVANPFSLDDAVVGAVSVARPQPSDPCRFGTVIAPLVRAIPVPVGLQNDPGCWLSGRSPHRARPDDLVLIGRSWREALDAVTNSSGFRWAQVGGVIVFRPTEAWAKSSDVLRTPVGPFVASGTLRKVVIPQLLKSAHPPLFWPTTSARPEDATIDRWTSVSFRGGTLLDGLNAVVAAYEGAAWEVGYQGRDATLLVYSKERWGDAVFAPLRPNR